MKNLGPLKLTTPTDREIVMTRVFNAPRRVVWDAHTSPAHLPHWMLGPEGWTMPVCEVDLCPGGEWHFVWRGSDGSEMGMRGVYRTSGRPNGWSPLSGGVASGRRHSTRSSSPRKTARRRSRALFSTLQRRLAMLRSTPAWSTGGCELRQARGAVSVDVGSLMEMAQKKDGQTRRS